MENVNGLKTFFILFLCTFFLHVFSQVGVFAYEKMWKVRDVYPSGTEIANVHVSGLEEEAAYRKVQAAVQQWKSGEPVRFSHYNQEILLSKQAFSFDIQDTFSKITSGKQIPLSVKVDTDLLYQEMGSGLTIEQWREMDKKRLQEELEALASVLQENNEPIVLSSYMENEEEKNETAIYEAKHSIPVDVQMDVKSWVEQQNTLSITSKEGFSFLETLKKAENLSISNDGATFIASTIYEVILHTNFDIVERSISPTKPTNIPLGYESKIIQDEMDFRFYNLNPISYRLVFKIEKDALIVSMVGKPFPHQYNVQLKDEQRYKPRTVIQYSGQLLADETVTRAEGLEGYSVHVYREAVDEEGKAVESMLIGEDFYAPVHRIEVHPYVSPPQPEVAEEEPEGTDNEKEQEEKTTENEGNSSDNEGEATKAESSSSEQNQHTNKPNE